MVMNRREFSNIIAKDVINQVQSGKDMNEKPEMIEHVITSTIDHYLKTLNIDIVINPKELKL